LAFQGSASGEALQGDVYKVGGAVESVGYEPKDGEEQKRMQRKHRAEMGPTRYKPDHNDHDENKVIDEAARLPESDGVNEERPKRAGGRFAKTLGLRGKCGFHGRVSRRLREADGTKIHGHFLLSSTL